MPVLKELGYGEHTLHKILEQQTYTLKDPEHPKGQQAESAPGLPAPRVREGVVVMEVKGTDVVQVLQRPATRGKPRTKGEIGVSCFAFVCGLSLACREEARRIGAPNS
jgi:hypothetical protein